MRIFKFFLIVIVAVSCWAGHVFSLPSAWQFVGWYGGGCYPHLAIDPQVPGRVYLTSDVTGIYRSDDRGDHWRLITQGLDSLMVTQLIVAPTDSNILYAATKGGVHISKDAGEHWKRLDNLKGSISFQRPDNYRSIAVDAKDPERLCVGTAKGKVFCLKGSSDKWTELKAAEKYLVPNKPVTAVLFDSQGRILAASSSGIVRCLSDQGPCEQLQGPQNVTDLVISRKNPHRLYAAGEPWMWMSMDDGKTWEKSSAVMQGKTYRIAVDESVEVPLIYVAWNKDWKGGVQMSRDEGKNWEGIQQKINADVKNSPSRVWADKNGKVTGLFLDPLNPHVLFRTDWWGVWRSDDGGRTWDEKIVGAPNTVATQMVITPNNDWFVASMDNGLLKSVDQGVSYQSVFPTKWDPARVGHVWRVDTAGETIIATSSPWEERNVNQVILSQDNGATFELIRAGLPAGRPKTNTMWGEGYPRALAVDPVNPDNIYLGIDGDNGGGLFISRDRGKTWQRSEGQPGSLRVYHGLAVDPTNPQRIVWGACAKNGGVYISTNAGQTFDYVFKDMTWVFDVKVSVDGTIFAAGDSNGAKLFVSRNQGQTWSLAGDFGKGRALASIAVDPSDPKRVAVATTSWGNEAPNQIFLSLDAGKTFNDVTLGLPDGAGASNMLFDHKSNSLYITRYAGSVYRLKL